MKQVSIFGGEVDIASFTEKLNKYEQFVKDNNFREGVGRKHCQNCLHSTEKTYENKKYLKCNKMAAAGSHKTTVEPHMVCDLAQKVKR